MLGDNLYGGSNERDYQKKFEEPYKPILDAKVKFYASLGNHDNPNQRLYKLFNMNGERYYTLQARRTASGSSRSTATTWTRRSSTGWRKSSPPADRTGRSRSSTIRSTRPAAGTAPISSCAQLLEPMFLKYGVDAVFAGHEHFYERIKPQKGIYYFISGGAAKLRAGDVGPRSELTAKGFDTGYHFMLIELDKDALHFQAISDQGKTVDSGTLPRLNDQDKKKLAGL